MPEAAIVAAPPGWEALLSSNGAETLATAERELASGSDSIRVGAELRTAGVDSDLIAAVLTQAELRRRAAAKFGPLAELLLFTPAGLEQATRAPIAALHAARFAEAGCRSVADLGCGIGAESLALASAGIRPHAVELDPFTARIAEHNLAAVGSEAPVTVGDAERMPLPAEVDGVFLDPARRTAGHRDTRRVASPDDYSPSLGFAFAHGDRLPTGVKLGPGLDRELIPDGAEAQWVSSDGQLVEMGLWFGAVARPGLGRAALVHRSGRGSSPDEAHELTAPADTPDADERPLGEFLYEPDGAVIRARLIGSLAERLDAGMVSGRIAYLTGDRAVATPFATGFRVLEELPVKEKELRRALADRGIGRLEIKKRGADVDPAALRKRLKLRGAEGATLFLTRAGGRHVALLAERL
ncbi:THUMP-like domain-containing protein [Leucobacter ruminantium]|uniref:THUMP-like domain-containing protein n=1 Tax=Leucobacter ruminantium TaxID=1289170 RepID=UPI001FB82DBA|nr:methyltransferase domain-containing protein [Leucobacter ruminantium]